MIKMFFTKKELILRLTFASGNSRMKMLKIDLIHLFPSNKEGNEYPCNWHRNYERRIYAI